MKTLTISQFVSTLRYRDASNPTINEVTKRARFLEKYPAQEANVLSLQANANCQCSRDIATAITNDVDKVANLSYAEGEPISIVVPTQVMGKIITIDDTEAAFTALTQRFQTEMFMFRGLTIVPATIDGVAKLRVFFF